MALSEHFAQHRLPRMALEKDDVVIHLRCGDIMTGGGGDQMGFYSFDYYANIINRYVIPDTLNDRWPLTACHHAPCTMGRYRGRQAPGCWHRVYRGQRCQIQLRYYVCGHAAFTVPRV